MNMVNIIPFEDKYSDRLVELESKCFSDPWTKEMFESEFRYGQGRYFLAVDGGEVVGYAGMWLVLDEGQITNVAVSPDHRRQGIARALVTQLIEHTRCAFYTLEVRAGNTAAVELYRSLGFREAGIRKG